MSSTVDEEEISPPQPQQHPPCAGPVAGDAGDDDVCVDDNSYDPLRTMPPDHIRDGDHVLLVFVDGRQIFAQCVLKQKGKKTCLKLNKRSYGTANLVGLPYGTVMELTSSGFVALPDGEGLLPDYPLEETARNDDASAEDTTFPPILQQPAAAQEPAAAAPPPDNRHLIDDNTSQLLKFDELKRLRESGADGSTIVHKIIQNSATFEQKTDYSKAKYVARKQMKYQQRFRLVRCTASSICQALFLKDPKKLMNMRDDTLGQILSYSNVSAGCQVLIFEESGVITGALSQRMGGYGRILSLYTGQQPGWTDILQRFNLSFPEQTSIKFVHAGDIFGEHNDPNEFDEERAEREVMEWPCPLQTHTRAYMKTMESQKDRDNFLARRCARFARKLTRHSPLEAKHWLSSRQSDSLILATRYDPTDTLLQMLPYLAPSSPFVIYSEFIEPLTQCFKELQEHGHAINLRLSDTWTREYQVLPGRTHPNMNMSQSGGFILTGIKLDPETGRNELDENLLKEIRAEIGGRRGKKKGNPLIPQNGKHGSTEAAISASAPATKRQRTDEA